MVKHDDFHHSAYRLKSNAPSQEVLYEYTNTLGHILQKITGWVGQNPNSMSVQLKVMYLFHLTHLERQKKNWRKGSTNTL